MSDLHAPVSEIPSRLKARFLPKFPVFVQDWLSSMRVRSMTLEERGAFLELLLLQWQEGGLPGDQEALMRLAGIERVRPILIEAFPLDADGLRRNPKCAAVRAECEAYCESQKVKAKAGAHARWHAPGNARALPHDAPPTPTPTPIENTPPTPRGRGKAAPPPVGWRALLPEFPSLDVPAVRSALERWCAYRRERRIGQWVESTWRTQLKEAVEWGADGFIAAIDFTIKKGWQGLSLPESRTSTQVKRKAGRIASDFLYGTPEWCKANGRDESEAWKPSERSVVLT